MSFDSEEDNAKFAQKFRFPFPLLCDTERRIGLAYGAAGSDKDEYAKRIGYVIDENGHIDRADAKVDPKTFIPDDATKKVIADKIERIRTVLTPQAKTLAEGLRALRIRVGLPNGLAAEGVTEADVAKLADKAFEDACHRCNPVAVTRDDLAALYRASM